MHYYNTKNKVNYFNYIKIIRFLLSKKRQKYLLQNL